MVDQEDKPLNTLFENIVRRMNSQGIILIEGRSPNDPKIKRSIVVDNMANDDVHLRRVYTRENMTALAQGFSWEIVEITENQEEGFVSTLHMLRLVARCSQKK